MVNTFAKQAYGSLLSPGAFIKDSHVDREGLKGVTYTGKKRLIFWIFKSFPGYPFYEYPFSWFLQIQ